MPRKTKHYDLPVHFETREKIRKKKGKKSYDDFINEILKMEFSP